MKIKVQKKTWDVQVLTKGEFVRRFGEGFAATRFTENRHNRAVYFNGKPSKATIMHELIHLLLSYSEFGKIGNTDDDNEEIVCETLEKKIEWLVKTTRKIFNATR